MTMVDVIHWKRLWTSIFSLLVVVGAIPRDGGDDPFPLRLVPMSSSSANPNFTKWTPKNWTQTSSDVMISNNLHLLQIPNGSSFHVVVPDTDSQRIRMGTTPKSRMCHSVFLPASKSGTFQERSYQRTGHSLQRTSDQSLQHHCTYAMNGGPFQRDGSLCGAVVVENGTIVSSDFGSMVGFGIAKPSPAKNATKSAETSVWILGRFENAKQAKEWNVQQFVSGFDWLVYDGRNIASYRNNTTGAARAARSAVGVTRHGTLLLVVSDGCEHCFRNQGLTLEELAAVMIEFQAAYAINFDGGSSSVMVHQSTVISHPSCISAPIARWFQCERPVGSTICIR